MTIDLAVKRTIEYANKFGSYLNKKEISERLISKKIFLNKIMTKEINKIKKSDVTDECFISKFNKAKILSQKIEDKFNDILFLGVTGSVASGHPKKNDDIDLLVITKNNSLWKTRLFLRWWIFKNQIPHRKYGEKEKNDEFCFNLWLDEESLLLPKNK